MVGKNVGILCGREWEAVWEVSWIVDQHCVQKGVFCPLQSCALSSPHQLQGDRGQDPAGRAVWGGRSEMMTAAGCECQEEELWSQMAQGHPVWGGVNPQEDGRSCSHDFASSSLGTKSSHAGWAELFFLYYSKLITCKPHDSLTIPALLLQQLAATSTQVCEYGFLCHLLKGNLPAASLWLPWDQFLGVQGGAVWAKPSGPRLGTITRPRGTGRWYFWTHW